ncbi:MAG: metallophosphoesterase [Microthrixaceae bacterium]
MLIAQITDPHVTVEGSMIRSLVDTPARLAEALAQCAALPRTPDLILMTGDLVNDGTAAEYDLLAEVLAGTPAPILPIPGNHDDPERLATTFAHLDCCPVALPDRRPFHYTYDGHVEADHVRFVALDSTLAGHHSGRITPESAAWLDDRLAESRVPTIVFLHHTPYATGSWWFDYQGVAGADLLREVVCAHPHVLRVVAGHVHRATSTQWGGPGTTRVTLSTAPSTAFLAGTGVAGGPPVIVDQRAPVTLFDVDRDGTLVASESDMPGDHVVIDARHLGSDWETYERKARAGGPITFDDDR